MREEVEKIVDNLLSVNTIIVLNYDKQKIDELKNWTDEQEQQHYELRERGIEEIMKLIEG